MGDCWCWGGSVGPVRMVRAEADVPRLRSARTSEPRPLRCPACAFTDSPVTDRRVRDQSRATPGLAGVPVAVGSAVGFLSVSGRSRFRAGFRHVTYPGGRGRPRGRRSVAVGAGGIGPEPASAAGRRPGGITAGSRRDQGGICRQASDSRRRAARPAGIPRRSAIARAGTSDATRSSRSAHVLRCVVRGWTLTAAIASGSTLPAPGRRGVGDETRGRGDARSVAAPRDG